MSDHSRIIENPAVIFCGIAAGCIFLKMCCKSSDARSKTVENDVCDEPSKQEKASIRQKYTPKKIPDGIDTIVIGSGMGGLSCAAILARLGHKVLVLEQHNDVAGGGTHQFDLGGYRFGSGLHYTVPWSVPIFALTCLKLESEVCQFKLMGDAETTVDKIHLHNIDDKQAHNKTSPPFNMKLKEAHMAQLYADFPDEHAALDKFMKHSDDAMLFVKYFIFARLLPKWMQRMYWKYIVPKSVVEVASMTAEELLPKLTSNARLIALLSSMWIDTGARPDQASFMMTAAVFRGVAMEGGCYPAKGAEIMAIELVRTIQEHGGSVLIRAHVQEILLDANTGSVTGVRVMRARASPNSSTMSSSSNSENTAEIDSMVIPCKRVVSSTGYVNTFNHLISPDVAAQYKIPSQLTVPQSAGFVMANIGEFTFLFFVGSLFYKY